MAAAVVRLMTNVSADPPPAVAAAHDGLAERLNLAGVPPVWIQPLRSGIVGLCPWDGHGQEGEIVLSPVAAGLEQPDADALARGARVVIIHELSHRLLIRAARQAGQGLEHDHDAAFFAVQLLLLFRSGDTTGRDSPAWWHTDLYDMHEHADDSLIGLGQALGWAWRVAHELARTKKSAEDCALEVLQKYLQWRAWLEDAPARARKQELAQARARADAQAIKRRLMVAAASGWLLAGVLLWAH